MKTKLLRGFLLVSLFLFPAASFVPPVSSAAAEAATVSKAECVTEISSLRFLHRRNAAERLPMASTTKILTAILIIDDCDLTESVEIPKAAEGTEGSSVYLRAGDVYTVEELLYGLMLRSGNDCAVTLALHHSGSVEKFARAMNRKALSLGAENSRFKNPHGLPDPEHYTTAQDLAVISAYAMKNEKFREIVSCKYYEPRNWQNKNKMLWNYEGGCGVKTGFTVAAGRCLVSAAERDDMTLVCVVLNSPQMFERSSELLDQAFAAYSMQTLCSPEQPIDGYGVKYSFRYPLREVELSLIRTETELRTPLSGQENEIAGQMRILLENDLLFSQNLYIMKK